VALVVLAVFIVAWLLFTSSDPYRLRLTLDNASQLVKGNQVKVGGVPVGSVERIELADDGRALIEVSVEDTGLTPLHEGTRAEVRSASLSGVANRYVAITPGPVSEPKLEDGADVPAEDTQAEVDLDEVLNTLDPQTLRDLKLVVRNGASGLSGRGEALGRAVDALDPALSQAQAVEREILRDQDAFTRFLVESADVVSAVATRDEDLEQAVSSGRATMDELASRDVQLDSLLRRAPDTLRHANTTLVNLRATLRDVDPALVEARPAAPLLARFLDDLRPVARRARPVVASLRSTIDSRGNRDLLGVLRRVPRLERIGVPTLDSAVATVDDLLPVVREIRPYTPDLIGGQVNGFGGSTSGYYDANGHYTRISFQGSPYTPTNILSLLGTPPTLPGLTGYRNGLNRRCPGAATQPHPDGSNPFPPPGDVCDPSESPR
jgi:phospholipid/cholesterol/gamma-HCH transport system substrate-binding protein